MSRSTWACELKCKIISTGVDFNGSRSTWACELKLFISSIHFLLYCHAPRERVSWNILIACLLCAFIVTLHVSVWVEIFCLLHKSFMGGVTLHVSVWVEIKIVIYKQLQPTSRSTWACELKFVNGCMGYFFLSHAPRERVSWNDNRVIENSNVNPGHAPRERVSWNSNILAKVGWNLVTLHVSVWVEISYYCSSVCWS